MPHTMTLIGLVRVTRDPRNVQEQHDAVDPMCAQVFEEESSRRRLLDSRPALLTVVEQLGTGDRLVVRKVRDLAQSMVDGWEVLIDLIEHGVAVRVLEGSDAGDYDKLSDIREPVRDITESRRSILSDRIKRGLQAAREGGAVGGRRESPIVPCEPPSSPSAMRERRSAPSHDRSACQSGPCTLSSPESEAPAAQVTGLRSTRPLLRWRDREPSCL